MHSGNSSVGRTIDEINRRWGGFPNCTTLGTYCYFTQAVQLKKVSPSDFEGLKNSLSGSLSTIQAVKKIYPVSQHEYTHWVDMNCSIYGLRILRNLAQSYQFNPDLHCEAALKEDHFFYAKIVADSIRQICLPRYYSVINKGVASRPWKYEVSMGHGFDATGKPNSDPIIFLRFSDSENKFFARQPLSLSSILEGNATFQEILTTLSTNLMIENEDERIVESKTDEQRLIEQLYNKDLTLYSVAAHFLASNLKTTNVVEAYKAVALLTKFALNCPQALLTNFSSAQIFIGRFGPDVACRIQNSIRRGNVETLFFYAATILGWQSPSTANAESIYSMLAKLCFGIDLDKFQETIGIEVSQLCGSIEKTNFPNAKIIASAAMRNNKVITGFNNVAYSFDELHIPPCFLANDEEMHTSARCENNLLEELPITDHFLQLTDNEEWIRKFSEACYPRHEIYD